MDKREMHKWERMFKILKDYYSDKTIVSPLKPLCRTVMVCLKCDTELQHFSGLEHIPEFFYCPECNDTAYDYDGDVLFSEAKGGNDG